MSRQRQSYSLQFKIDTVDHYRKNKNVTTSAQVAGVSRTQIRAWDRSYERFVVENVGPSRSKLKLHKGRVSLTSAFDKELWDWYNKNPKNVMVKDLCQKAVTLSLKHGLLGFKASKDWSIRWRKNHGIPVRVTYRKTQDFMASRILVTLK